MVSPAREPADHDLPPDLLALASEALLDAEPAQRERVLADLQRAHAPHARALQRLADDLASVQRLLDAGFRPPAGSAALATIGPYRVLRTLGEGAFGIVYLCAQSAPVQREVAVKVL